jgi:hypothetical protein
VGGIVTAQKNGFWGKFAKWETITSNKTFVPTTMASLIMTLPKREDGRIASLSHF